MPRFSIVVPVYNVVDYLAQCIESLQRQGFDDWEAICVDDGSTDGSGALLDQLGQHEVRLHVIHQPNQGLATARNRGIEAAQGEYVLFVDSDDWLEPDTLGHLHTHAHGQDMICFGGWVGEQEERMQAECFASGWDYYNRHALEHRFFSFVCVVLRCYRRQFLMDENLRFREGILHEDNHFTPRACLVAGAVEVVPYLCYHYRVREGSIMTTRSLRNRQDMLRVANDLSAHFMQQMVDCSVVYRALTQYYQVAFVDATRDEDEQLLPLVNWTLYHTVSRTRLRHRLNYLAMHISPALYRLLNHFA